MRDNSAMRRAFTHAAVILGVVAMRAVVVACTRVGPVVPEDMVAAADLIVRANAVEYSRVPASAGRTTGPAESVVHFRIDEVVKGRHAPTDLDLPGYLGGANDFNELPVPYHFVRRDGRRGSCFANTYRQGADYLLVLKLAGNAYTVDWYVLGPTNEQLHSADDPWLKWVRSEVGPRISALH
jgi:hypothetical protein